MVERESMRDSLQRILASMVGSAVARTILRQADFDPRLALGSDAESVRAFVEGVLPSLLAPVVGPSEALRVASQVERELAHERAWTIPRGPFDSNEH